MPFDPNYPINNSQLMASEVRNQLNAINDLITALTLRVAALENPPLTSTGFGEAGANGVLTQTGMTNGYPEYSIAGGYTLRYGPTPNGPSRYWILANVTDEWFQSRYDNAVSGDVITGNVWQQGMGSGPVGTIS